MMRQNFDQQLQKLQDDMLSLGSMVESAIIDSVNVLKKRDMDGSRQLILP
jgi:phosphate transport system protein